MPARFKTSEQEEQFSIATTLDVSALGACLVTKEVVKIGQELLVQLTLPKGEKIYIRVKVVWIKEREYYGIDEEFLVGIKILEPLRADELKFIKFFAKEFLKSPPLP